MFVTLVYYDKDGDAGVEHFTNATDKEVVQYIREKQIPLQRIKVITFQREKERDKSIFTRDDISDYVTSNI